MTLARLLVFLALFTVASFPAGVLVRAYALPKYVILIIAFIVTFLSLVVIEYVKLNRRQPLRSSEDIIRMSAALRGQRNFNEAIKLITDNISKVDEDLKVNALLEAFYAAKEMGDAKLTKQFAHQVHSLDSGVPSVQSYL